MKRDSRAVGITAVATFFKHHPWRRLSLLALVAVAACGAGDRSPGGDAAHEEHVGESRQAVNSAVTEDFSTGIPNVAWPEQWSTYTVGASTAITVPSGTEQVGRMNGSSGGRTDEWLLGRAPSVDSESVVSVYLSASTPLATLMARRVAFDTYYGVSVGVSASTDRLRLFKATAGTPATTVLSTATTSPPFGVATTAAGAWYRLRFKVTQQTSSTTLLQARLWLATNTEPTGGWTVQWTDNDSSLQNVPGYNGLSGTNGSTATRYVYFDDYQLVGAASANACTVDADCGSRSFCSQAGECRYAGTTCSADAMCGSGQTCKYGSCACPPNGSCQLNGGASPTLADLMAGLPSLNYRAVTFARDSIDYFTLPTPTPVGAAVSPVLRRSNHFIFNVPATAGVTLTFDVANSSSTTTPLTDVVVRDATGSFLKRAVLDSAKSAHLQNVIQLGALAAGNYEFDVAPSDPALTYTVTATTGVTVALKGGADLSEAGSSVYFFVPAEVDTAVLLGQFDATSPVQFFPPSTTAGSVFFTPDTTPIAPQVITPNKVYVLDTHGKPGIWRATFRTSSSPAHFLNLPDVFSFDPTAIVASKRIRTDMLSPTGGSPTAVTSPNLKYNNRFSFHVSSGSAPTTFTFGTGSSTTSPPSISVKLLDASGNAVGTSPYLYAPGQSYQLSVPLQPGDYEFHVTNPSIYNAYAITVPPNLPFVSVDGYGLGAVASPSYRAYFTVPPYTPSLLFAAQPVGNPIDVYNPSGAFIGAPTPRGNNVYEIGSTFSTTAATWAINVNGDHWTDIRLLNAPQIISFTPNLRETLGPGGIIQCTGDADCPSGDVCGTDNGAKFGLAATADVCSPPTCCTAQQPANSSGNVLALCGLCPPAQCFDGVRDGTETDIDCGGECGKCATAKGCASDLDCASGLACGTNNAGCFGGARANKVCWPTQCQDGVDATECGQASSPCGQYCACVKDDCDPANPTATCPSGESCKVGLGQLFGSDAPAVCVTTGAGAVCPSNDRNLCGQKNSLCGVQCVSTPDCSAATPANPDDKMGGHCPHLCPDGQSCCTDDIDCAVGSTCLTGDNGAGVCRPGPCADQHLAPPLCGHAGALCGDQCPACTPTCDGRQCGLDTACGTSCGTCPSGSYCDAAGACAPDTSSIVPIQVPDGNGGTTVLPDLPAPAQDPHPVGALAGEFSVSDEGTAQYNIPIAVPPGRAGLEPALSLHYTGTRANGDLGVGWRLEGLSKITRCPRINALDGYAAPVRNEMSDRFCIDGKRLEKVGPGDYGADGVEYRTLIDTFTQVISHTDVDPLLWPPVANMERLTSELRGPDYFTVRMKDGRILTYGRTRDSLIAGNDGARHAWLLNRVEDRSHNTILFTYKRPPAPRLFELRKADPNTIQPDRIAYTGHNDTAGTREVRFSYEPRADAHEGFYQGGTPESIRERLKRIVTYVRNSPVRTYLLHYPDTNPTPPNSQIDSITECPGVDEQHCKSPTTFEYEAESGFTEGWAGVIKSGGVMDANGDGVPDFLSTEVTVGDTPADPKLQAGYIVMDVGTTIASQTGPYGEAAAALWGVIRGPLLGLLAKKPKVTFTHFLEMGTGSSDRTARPTTSYSVTGLACDTAPSFLLDYDHDGKDDVASYCGGSLLRILRSSGDGSFHGYPTNDPVIAFPPSGLPTASQVPPLLYDVDGDGLQDLISCKDIYTLEVRLRSSATPWFADTAIEAPGLVQHSQLPIPLPTISPYCGLAVPTYQTFDIDGDGTPELLTYLDPAGLVSQAVDGERLRGWYALRFTRSSSGVPTLSWQLVDFPNVGLSGLGQDMQLGDLNGDGLTDIWQAPSTATEAHIWLNTGNNQFVMKTTARPRPVYDASHDFRLTNTGFVDYDADGRLDILEHWTGPEPVNQANVLLQPNSLLQSLAVKVSPPDLPDLIFHGPAEHSAIPGLFDSVGDVDGDGNADLFGQSGQVYYGSGLKNQFLKSVRDGLGKEIHVQYDDPGTYTATCTDASVWPEKCLKRMRGLVSAHDERLGGVIERRVSYTYTNARVNVTGHGWLGFDRRTVKRTNGTTIPVETVATDFWPVARFTPAGAPATDLSAPYLYPLAGMPKRVVTDQFWDGILIQQPLEDAPHSRRETVENTWDVKVSADGRPYPFLSSRDTSSWSVPVSGVVGGDVGAVEPTGEGQLRSECVDTNIGVDGYGNVTERLIECPPQFDELPIDETHVWTQFVPDRPNWLVGNPVRVTTESRREFADQTQIVAFGYDDNGLLQSVTRAPLAQDSTFEYTSYGRNEFGNVTYVAKVVKNGDPERDTVIAYDGDQIFPATITSTIDGHVLTTSVLFNNYFGGIAKLVDPNRVAVRQAYDSLGLLRLTDGPSGATTYAYASENLGPVQTPAGVIYPVTQISLERQGLTGSFGGASVEEIDPYGRSVRSRSRGFGGDEIITERAYDARGRLIGTSAPHLADAPEIPISTYTYDFLDRPLQTNHGVWSGGSATIVSSPAQREYASVVSLGTDYQKWLVGLDCGAGTTPADCATDVALSTDEAGQSNVVVVDHLGRTLRSIDGENLQSAAHTSDYHYGPFGRLGLMVDNSKTATTFVYDDYGRLTSHDDPATGTMTYTYNGFDEVSTSLDAKNQLRLFHYDTLGRLRSIHDAVAGDTTWDYDEGESALGQLTHSSSPPTPDNPLGQQIDYTYEPATPQHHRALPKTISYLIDGDPYVVGLAYDDLARPDTVDYPQVGSGTPVRAKYGYDLQSGGLTSVSEVGSGTTHPIWKIDTAFQGYLPQQETFGNGAVTTFDYDPDRRWLTGLHTAFGGNTVQDLAYTHFDNGQVHDRVTPDKTEEFSYDALGRLSSLLTNGIGTPTSYQYDDLGNIALRGGVTSTYQPAHPHLVDQVGANTYHYDANGNLENRVGPDIPGGSQTFVYTPFDLPNVIIKGSGAAETVTQLDYDANGSRVVRRDAQGSRHFVAGLYERVLSPTSDTMEEHFRISAGSGVVAEIIRKPASEETFYFHQDHLGTPETITDDHSNVVHQEYGPFGELVGNPPFINANTTRIGFTGQQQDNDLALTDMGGRLYDPIAARFTTADPVMQAPFWSQGLNRYSYVFNDPLNNTDPSGYEVDCPGCMIAGFNGVGIVGGILWYGDNHGWFDAAASAGSAGESSGAGAGAGAKAGLASTVAGSTTQGLQLLNGATNLIQDVTAPAFMGTPGARYAGPVPSAAPNSTGHNPQGLSDASAQSKLPGPPVQERTPESYAAGPKNAIPCPKSGCDPTLGLEFAGSPAGVVIEEGVVAGEVAVGLLDRLLLRVLGEEGADAFGRVAFRGLVRNRLLRDLTANEVRAAFKGTPFKLSNHAIKRLLSPRTAKLGVTTLRDVEALLNKGVIEEGANGVGAIVKDGFEAVVNLKTRVIITFAPH